MTNILIVLLSLTWAGNEPADERMLRAATMATAVHFEAQQSRGPLSSTQVAAATLTTWNHETRFAVGVHAGGVGRWGSDLGKARCMGQLHLTGLIARDEWLASGGLDLASTRMCARLTMRVLQVMARRCQFDGSNASWHRVFSAYGSGKGCAPVPKLKVRVKTLRKIEAKMRQGEKL
jgi:hypothetical protein